MLCEFVCQIHLSAFPFPPHSSIDHSFPKKCHSWASYLLFWLLFSFLKCMCVWGRGKGMGVPSTTTIQDETPDFPRVRSIFPAFREKVTSVPRETPLGLTSLWSSLSPRPLLCSPCYPWGTSHYKCPNPSEKGVAEGGAVKSVILLILLTFSCFTVLCCFHVYSTGVQIGRWIDSSLSNSFPYRLLPDHECSSLCYTVSPYWLSILYSMYILIPES